MVSNLSLNNSNSSNMSFQSQFPGIDYSYPSKGTNINLKNSSGAGNYFLPNIRIK
jgi:hypothetical protein